MRRLLAPLSLVLVLLSVRGSIASEGISVERRAVTTCGKTFHVSVVSVPLDKYRPKIGLAKERVGATESLKGIVQRCKAVAGINGSFFDAYTKNTIKPPYHNLATGGEYYHLGTTGTTLGFDADGNYRMEPLRITLRGKIDDNESWFSDWYAYFFNHPADTVSSATAFTSAWVGGTTPDKGIQIAVSNGIVQSISRSSMSIPQNGFVLQLTGGEESMARRFHPGARCHFYLEFKSPDSGFWNRAQEVIGCGPTLIRNGEVCVDPTSEGFRNAKILTASGQRSAVGITRDRHLLIVTCASATIRQLGSVMKAIGAWNAMNLDGGASSALWANDHYITGPGRDLSNALLIVAR